MPPNGGAGCGDAPLVGLVRVELTTSRLSGVRSNHLSYRPKYWIVTALDPLNSGKAAIQKREESLRESELCGPAFAKATFL